MGRQRTGRLELRVLGPGPRGQIERDDGRTAEFEGWTDLGRAIHELTRAESEADHDNPSDEGERP